MSVEAARDGVRCKCTFLCSGVVEHHHHQQQKRELSCLAVRAVPGFPLATREALACFCLFLVGLPAGRLQRPGRVQGTRVGQNLLPA